MTGEDHASVTRPIGPFDRHPSILVIGAGAGERAERFTEAAVSAGFGRPLLFSWADILSHPDRFETALADKEPALLRLEAHDGDFDCWLALVAAGADAIAASGRDPLARQQLEALRHTPGLSWRRDLSLMHEQAYLGLNSLANRVAAAAARNGAILLNDPEGIAVCGDKKRCHAAMRDLKLSVPERIEVGEVSTDSLFEAMKAADCPRVFVKLRYGSSAMGVIALAVSSFGLAAWAPAEIVGSGDSLAIYTCKQVRRFSDRTSVTALLLSVLTSGAQVEAWIPKAGHQGSTVDLRLLTIAGEPGHVVLRQAKSPITNLHLGARRGDAAPFLDRLCPGVWDRVCAEARSFARAFPKALQIAFDIAVPLSLNRACFLEANAFGDLLRRSFHNGLDPYAAQFAALPLWMQSQSACPNVSPI